MSELRIGVGVDAHAFADDVPLVLAGVAFDHPRGLAGHSDGDVIAHALTDALLGAAGLADIGALFPSSDERWRGADSIELLRARLQRGALGRLRARQCGLRPRRTGADHRSSPRRDEATAGRCARGRAGTSSTFARRRPTGSGSPVGAKGSRPRRSRCWSGCEPRSVRRPARSPGAPVRDALAADVSGVHASQRARPPLLGPIVRPVSRLPGSAARRRRAGRRGARGAHPLGRIARGSSGRVGRGLRPRNDLGARADLPAGARDQRGAGASGAATLVDDDPSVPGHGACSWLRLGDRPGATHAEGALPADPDRGLHRLAPRGR